MTQFKTSTNQLTTRESNIIHLLYRFRFLTRSQIQHFLHHKDHKTIQLWLNQLISSKFISTASTNNIRPESKARIYLLAEGGVKYLIATDSIDPLARQRLRKDSERSESFIRHQLLLADIYLDLERQNTDSDSFEMFVRAEYTGLPVRDILEELKPDAYLVRQRGENVHEYLLEILNNDFAEGLRARVKRYLAAYQGCEWEETERPFPTIQLACPNERTLYYLAGYIRRLAKLQNIPDVHIRLTTVMELESQGVRGTIWSEVNCAEVEAN